MGVRLNGSFAISGGESPVSSRIWARWHNAVEPAMVASKPLPKRRHLPIQAKVREITHMLGRSPNPVAVPGRLMICMVL